MKRILSAILTIAMLASMIATAVYAYDEDLYNSITNENVMSFEITDTAGNPKTQFEAGDTIWITANMDSIWGDPTIEDDIMGYEGNVLPGAYGMAAIASCLVFPIDTFTPKAGKDIKSLDSTIANAGIDPTTEEAYELNITKTTLSDAKTKGMYTFITESDTFNGDEDLYVFFTGEGLICRWILTVNANAADGTYKLPIGAYKWCDDGDPKYTFFGNGYDYVGHSDSQLKDRPVKFISPTGEQVYDDPTEGAYITIQIGSGVSPDQAAAAEVDALIAAIGTVTLDSEAAITAARTAYDALTDAQKELVTGIGVLEAAETEFAALKADAEAKAAAAEVDALIDAIGEVTLDSEEAIAAARIAYVDLSEAAQAYVTKLAVLEAAEAKIIKLQNEAVAKEQAAEVDAKIVAIGTVTLDSEAAIVAARDAYKALGATAQSFVTELATLEAAEAKLAELKAQAEAEAAAKAAAAEIDALIAAIGTVTLDSEAAIAAARAAVDAADEYVLSFVEGLETLKTAEATYAELKAQAEAEAAAKAAAADIDALIAAIGDVTLGSEAAIVAARAAVDAADEYVLTFVTGLDTLVAAEAKLAELKAQAEADAAAKAAAEAVDAKIAAIGTVTLDSEDAIAAARAAYEALSDDAKAYVTGLNTLVAAEAALAALKADAEAEAAAKAAAAAIDAQIAAIGTVTLDSEAAIAAARAAVNAADAYVLSFVTGLDTLAAAEAELAQLKADADAEAAAKAAAAAIDAQINAIGIVTLDSEAAIAAARAAVDAADAYVLSFVTGLDTLAAAEAKLAQLKADAEAEAAAKAQAADVDALIAAIGEVTLDSEDAIVAARAAYDALSDAAKAFVTGLDTLVAAEAKLDELQSDGALVAADAVNKMIADLGEISLDSIAAVEAARAAYDALSDEAKALVTELEALEAAEAAIAAKKAAVDKKDIYAYLLGQVPAVAPTGVTVVGGEEKLTVTWDAVDGAAKYWVYVNGLCFLSTTNTSATIARPAGEYEVSVRVALRATYGTAYAAGTSEAVAVTVAPKAPGFEITAAGVADNKIQIEWTAREGATKYWVVFTAADGNSYTFSTTNTAFARKVAPFAGEYSVVVRAYVDGKIIDSAAETFAC